MPRGRPPLATTHAERKIQLPADLDAQIQLLLYSPVEGRVPYGALSRLITPMLRKFLQQYEQAGRTSRGEDLLTEGEAS